MGSPEVSVIVPVRDGEDHLAEALASVMGQSFGDLECIVVDDGSEDGSARIAEGFAGVACLRQDRLGVAAARNRGVRESRGAYLAFLDADDRWDPLKLEIQVGYMRDRPSLGFSLTGYELFLDGALDAMPDWVRRPEGAGPYLPSCLLARREAFESLGGFDESYQVGEDSDWFLRARDAGIASGLIDRRLLWKRVRPGCLSSRTDEIRAALLRSVKASLARARERVSVVVPCYEGGRYLAEALDSVLAQTVAPGELILVDDGSTDATGEIARGYGGRLRYIRTEHRGAAAARNEGALRATGEYIAFLDADDLWEPRKLELQLLEIRKPGPARMAMGLVSQFYSPETDEAFRARFVCPSGPSRGEHPGTILLRRSDFLRIGPFSSAFETGEFLEWYQRALASGLVAAFVPEVVMRRRIHPRNHGIVRSDSRADYARAVVESLRLRRDHERPGER